MRPRGPTPSGAEALGLRVGDDVRHGKWGEGVILDIEGGGDKAEAVVRFPEVGEKRLLLAWAPLEKAGPVTRCSRTRSGTAGLALPARPHPRGAARAARRRCAAPTDLVEEADGGLTLTDRRGRRPGRPLGRRHRRPGRAGRAVVVVATPNGYELLLLCLAASPGRARSRCRSTRRCGPTRSTTSSRDSGAALVHPRRGRDRRRRRRSADARPGRARRRGRALLHVGHHRQAQGRRAHPPGPARRRSMAGALLPGGIRRDEAVVSLPIAHIMGFAVRCSALACAGIPVYFLPTLRPGARCSTPSRRRRATPLRRRARRCTGCCSRPGAEERDLQVGPGVGARAPTPCRPTWPPGSRGWARPRRCRSSGRSARRPSSRATAWSRPAAGWRPRSRRRCFDVGPRRRRGHARCPATRSRWSTTTGDEVRRGAVGELLGQGARACSTGYRGDAEATAADAHRRRLAAHRRPRPAGPARHRVLRRPQEGRHQARRLLGVRGRGRAGARGAPRRARGGRRRPARRAQGRGARRRSCGWPTGRRSTRPPSTAWADRAARRLQGRRSASSPSTSCPAPAPTRSSARSCSTCSSDPRAILRSRGRPGSQPTQNRSGWVRRRRDVAGVSGSVVVVVVVVRAAALRSTSSWPSLDADRVALEALAVGRRGERLVARGPERAARPACHCHGAVAGLVRRLGPEGEPAASSGSAPRCWRMRSRSLRPGHVRVEDRAVGRRSPRRAARRRRPGRSRRRAAARCCRGRTAPWPPGTGSAPMTAMRHGATASARPAWLPPRATGLTRQAAAIGGRREAPA